MSAMNITGQGHEVYFKAVSASAAGGDNSIITGDAVVPGDGAKPRKIRIFHLSLYAKAAVSVTFKSNTTPISGVMGPFAAGQPIGAVSQPSAHFLETAPGEAFVITTSADGVYGWVGYTLEGAR